MSNDEHPLTNKPREEMTPAEIDAEEFCKKYWGQLGTFIIMVHPDGSCNFVGSVCPRCVHIMFTAWLASQDIKHNHDTSDYTIPAPSGTKH